MKSLQVIALLVLAACSSHQAEPGLQQGRLAPCPASPNCVCSENPNRSIPPLTITGPQNKAWTQLRAAISSLNGEIVTDQGGYLHATFRSRIFGFIDDLECRQDGTEIQVRGAARSGWWDFGVNRRRIERLRDAL